MSTANETPIDTRRRPGPWRLVALSTAVAVAAVLVVGSAPANAATTVTTAKTAKTAKTAHSAAASGTLKWAAAYTPSSWDPVVDGSGATFRETSLAYGSLTEMNTKGVAVPGLAKSWTYNKAGTQVTFHLRSGLTFDDGSPVNAAAVKDYLVRAQTQKNSALVGEGIGVISSIDTPSDLDVVLNLSQPDFQLPQILAERVGQISSPKASPSSLNSFPDGAGPFKPVSIVPGSHAYFVKNPDFWDASAIHIARVDLYFNIDQSSVVSGLETGVYNFADLADPSQIPAAKAAGLDVLYQPGFNAENISINTNIAPFDNPKVLDAVRYAINREQIVKEVTFGTGSVTDEPFPKGYIAYDPKSANLYPYDPKKAEALLAEAGYKPGQLTIPFVVSSTTSTSYAELVQSQLAAVGIKTTIQVDPNWSEPFFASPSSLSLSLYGTTGRDSPIETLVAHFGDAGPLNLSRPYTSSAFTAAISKAEATPIGSADYTANIQAATRIGLATTPTIFTYSQPNIFVKTKAVSALPKVPAYVVWWGVRIKST